MNRFLLYYVATKISAERHNRPIIITIIMLIRRFKLKPVYILNTVVLYKDFDRYIVTIIKSSIALRINIFKSLAIIPFYNHFIKSFHTFLLLLAWMSYDLFYSVVSYN